MLGAKVAGTTAVRPLGPAGSPAARLSLLAGAFGVAGGALGLGFGGPVGEDAFWGALVFCLVAFVVPALVVLAAPWSLRRAKTARPDGSACERLAFLRPRHTGQLRAVLCVLPFCAGVVAWRLPVAVDGVASHPALVLAELATFVPTGIALWLELAASPPLVPRSPRPRRIVLAALPMWTTWIMAFVLGFSRSPWFPAYHHLAGHGLSFIADQQVTAGVLWMVAFCVFVPVEFTNIVRWLRADEDPDVEMAALVRDAARSGGLD